MSFVVNILLCIFSVIVAGYLFLKKKFSYFEENGIPHIKPTSWLAGNMKGVGTEFHLSEFFDKLYKEIGTQDVIAGFYGMFMPSYLVTDLELIRYFDSSEPNSSVIQVLFSQG